MPEENLVGRAMFRYWPFDSRAGNLNVPKYWLDPPQPPLRKGGEY
jgi:hypothetical protein